MIVVMLSCCYRVSSCVQLFHLPFLGAKKPFLEALGAPSWVSLAMKWDFQDCLWLISIYFLVTWRKDGNEDKIWASYKEERERLFGTIAVCYTYYNNCYTFLGHFTKYMHVCHSLPLTLMFKKCKSPVLAWLWWWWYFHMLPMNV